MKKLFLFSFIWMAAALASCSKEGSADNDNPANSKGSISISASTDAGAIAIIEKGTARAVDTDDYWVTITGPGDFLHEDVLSNLTTITDLEPGSYTVTVVSDKDHTHPALNEPLYKGSVTQTLKAAPEVTHFSVTCYQDNVGIRFAFHESVTTFYPDIKAIVEVSAEPSKQLTYLPSNELADDIFYFEAPSKLKISLKNGDANVAIGGEAFQEIDVSKKELWTITLKTSNILPGSVDFDVNVETGTEDKDSEFGVGEVTGSGTMMNPYTVSDAINVMPKKEVWLEGVITGSTITETRASSTFNILIGKAVDAPASQCIILNLDNESAAIRNALNLMDNSGLVGTTIKINGDIEGNSTDFTSPAFAVISNITSYETYEGDDLQPIHASGKVLRDAPFKVGFAVQTYLLDSDPKYLRTVRRDASSITGEYAMKMSAIWTSKDTYDFSGADMLVDFAKQNNMRVHGHTLIWHDGTPDWLKSYNGTRDEWIALMEDYITKVMTRYKGKVVAWDVVNEAYVDKGALLPEQYSVWYKNIGEEYIELAFKAARAADPDCILFYNDYGNEYDPEKHSTILAKIDELNAPENYVNGKKLVDGLGMQMHTEIWYPRLADQKTLLASVAEHVDYVHLSELDIKANRYDFIATDGLYEVQEVEQAAAYRDWFEAFMSLAPSKRYGITFWGVDDGHSWQLTPDPGNGRPYPDWPLLFNSDYSPKPAYTAIMDYIAGL